jgi:hypothetical protein
MSLLGATSFLCRAASRTATGSPYWRSSRHVWQQFFSFAQVWQTSVFLKRMPAPGIHRKTVNGRVQILHSAPCPCLLWSQAFNTSVLHGQKKTEYTPSADKDLHRDKSRRAKGIPGRSATPMFSLTARHSSIYGGRYSLIPRIQPLSQENKVRKWPRRAQEESISHCSDPLLKAKKRQQCPFLQWRISTRTFWRHIEWLHRTGGDGRRETKSLSSVSRL